MKSENENQNNLSQDDINLIKGSDVRLNDLFSIINMNQSVGALQCYFAKNCRDGCRHGCPDACLSNGCIGSQIGSIT